MHRIIGRKSIVDALTEECLGGHCVLLCGPKFVGKTAVLRELETRVRCAGRPCGYASRTQTVHDVTQALLEAYPQADKTTLDQRRLRSRLRRAVEDTPGVILLDHLQCAGTVLKGLLRSLRGTGHGVIIAADVEGARDHVRLRSMRLTYRERWLPRLSSRHMHQLLASRLVLHPLPHALGDADRNTLLHIATGRVGVIEMLAERLRDDRYWHEERIRAETLRNEVSMAVAQAYMDAVVARARGLGR
jgi:hypothetical protein